MSGMPLEALEKFDALVAEVMAEWQIPGLAMAVVRKGEPPLLRCWGLRDLETGAPVGSPSPAMRARNFEANAS